MNLLALNPTNPFGDIAPPPGSEWAANPIAGVSSLFIFGIQALFTVAAIVLLIYLLWGAYDWISSGGDPENLSKARAKMTNAAIGMVIMVAALGIFVIVAGDVLGIMRKQPDGTWVFKLPRLQNCVTNGATAAKAADCCSGTLNTADGKCKSVPTATPGP